MPEEYETPDLVLSILIAADSKLARQRLLAMYRPESMLAGGEEPYDHLLVGLDDLISRSPLTSCPKFDISHIVHSTYAVLIHPSGIESLLVLNSSKTFSHHYLPHPGRM